MYSQPSQEELRLLLTQDAHFNYTEKEDKSMLCVQNVKREWYIQYTCGTVDVVVCPIRANTATLTITRQIYQEPNQLFFAY